MPKKRPERLLKYDLKKKFTSVSGSVYFSSGDPTEHLILWARAATKAAVPTTAEDASGVGHSVEYQDSGGSGGGGQNQTALTTPFSSLNLANVNSAVRFPKSSTAYVNVEDAADLSFGDGSSDSSFSLSTWVQITSASSTVGLAQKGLGTGLSPNEYKIFYHDGGLTGSLSDVSASAALNFLASPGALFSENTWHHIAFTYNNALTKTGRGKFYFDGRFISGSCSETGTYVAMEAGAGDLRIAENMNNQPMEFMQGAIWTGKVLSAEDINALYNASKGIKDVAKQRVYVGSTGITSLPVRPYLQSIDNATGSYPTTYRLGDSRTGHYSSSFDDTSAIRFQKQGTNSGLSAQVTLGQQLRQGSQYSGSLVVAPNSLPDLALTSSATSVIPGVSDARVRFTPGDDFTPYVEVGHFAADEIGSNDQFWTTGTLPSIVGQGFTNPLWSKTKIEIDLNPTTDSDIFWSTGSAVSPIGSGFAYYNFDLRQWEMLGCDITGSAVDYINLHPVVATGSLLAHVPGRNGAYFASADPTKVRLQEGYPTTYAGFPSAVQFNATSSQLFDVGSVIRHPFMVEKVVYEFSGALPGAVGNTVNEATYFGFGILNHHLNANLLNSFATSFINSGTNQTGTPNTDPANYDMDQMKKLVQRRVTVPKDIVSAGITAISHTFEGSAYASRKRDLNLIGKVPGSGMYQITGSFILSMSANTPVYATTLQFHKGLSLGGRGGFSNGNDSYRFLSWQGGGRNGLTAAEEGGLLASGRSFARANASTALSGALNIIKFDSATSGIAFETYESVRQDAPYLLMPGDKLSFYWQNQKWPSSHLSNYPYVGEGSVADFKLRLGSGKGKVVLYGSMLRDGREFHQGLNQHLTSDAIHEDVQSSATDSTPYCLDQFNVEYYQTYSGSYSDYAVKGIQSRNPTVAAGRLSLVPHSVVGGQAGTTGSILRGVRLVDLNERYLDSLFVDPNTVARVNGQVFTSEVGTSIGGGTKDLKIGYYALGSPSGGGYITQTDTTWPFSFPFDDRYGGNNVERVSEPSSPTVKLSSRLLEENPEFRAGPTMLSVLAGPQDSGDSSNKVYTVLDFNSSSTYGALKDQKTQFLKFFFGFGDSINYNLPKAVKNVKRGNDANYSIGHASEIRGFKYGLISALPTFTSAVYRRDRFGQARDMFEQRQYSAFEKYKFEMESPNPRDNEGKRKDIPGQLASAVSIEFKKVSATGEVAEILPLTQTDFENIKALTKNNLRGVWGRGCNTDPFARSQRPYFDSDPRFPSGSFGQLGEENQVESMLSDLNQGSILPDLTQTTFGF